MGLTEALLTLADPRGSAEGLPEWLSGEESACQCRRHGLLVSDQTRSLVWEDATFRAATKLCTTTTELVL